jgi:tryptophan synthase beta subunit
MKQNNIEKFGDFGGRHIIPKILISALEELDYNYEKLKNDRKLQRV